jgi:hypothetical protein
MTQQMNSFECYSDGGYGHSEKNCPIQHRDGRQEQQRTLSDQRLEPTNALNDECGSNPFWPDGTESWHMHEIKPQREIFRQSFYSDLATTTQHIITEPQSAILEKSLDSQTNSLFDETVCQFDEANYFKSQHMTEPSMDQFKLSKKISTNTAKSLQIVSIVPVANEQQQSYSQAPEMIYLKLKLKPQDQWSEINRKPIQNDLSTLPNSFMQLSFHHRPHNRLLPFIVICLIQLSLFLFSVLLRIGIAHNMTKLSDILYDQ